MQQLKKGAHVFRVEAKPGSPAVKGLLINRPAPLVKDLPAQQSVAGFGGVIPFNTYGRRLIRNLPNTPKPGLEFAPGVMQFKQLRPCTVAWPSPVKTPLNGLTKERGLEPKAADHLLVICTEGMTLEGLK
jgi:hypothetical protein